MPQRVHAVVRRSGGLASSPLQLTHQSRCLDAAGARREHQLAHGAGELPLLKVFTTIGPSGIVRCPDFDFGDPITP